MNRRRFLHGAAASGVLLSSRRLHAASSVAPNLKSTVAAGGMPPWSQGMLDIHHISTGRGNSVLAICPDGTSIMIDAGAARGATDAMGPARPDASRRPGEWIGRYALRQMRAAGRQELDYFVLTHFHDDHMGAPAAGSPMSRAGAYRLSGVTDVAELVPVRRLLDRGFPEYSYPMAGTDDALLNYLKFARYAAEHGTAVERFKPGAHGQIVLQHARAEFPSFVVQNLASNGEVWTGQGEDTVRLFPDVSALKADELPTENACSNALRLSYGAFRYYIGGDLTCSTRFGTEPWMDAETPVARVAGPVSVAALDHHGYFDATGPEFVRAMRARVYVAQTWHASHPALSVLEELYSPVLAPGAHDVFATGLVPAAHLAEARLSDRMLSQRGHVVVRVAPGGERYQVFVVDDSVEDGDVQRVCGPYTS